ncbi:CEHC1 [Auxenochlorella protothecoides x Auxenochlorella symbiontica]
MNTDVHPSLYADALLIVVEYLDAKVLAKISCVQRAWRYALSSPTAQHLWLRALGRDWGDETAAGPPDRKCRGQPPHCLYREWVMFAGGCCPVAQAVVRAWKDIETWLSKNCPQIIRTLRPGATERQLRAAEATLGFPLPPGLRMILRVHDGQFLRPRGRWQSLDAFCGVFGGYSLYDDYVTMGLLSLGEILALSSSWNSQGGRDSSSLIFACSQGSVKQICIDKVNGAVASILGQAVAFPAAPEGLAGQRPTGQSPRRDVPVTLTSTPWQVPRAAPCSAGSASTRGGCGTACTPPPPSSPSSAAPVHRACTLCAAAAPTAPPRSP